MLKGLDPLLGADLLQVLRAMGHGDDLVIADANFPATTMGRRLVRLDGVRGAAGARGGAVGDAARRLRRRALRPDRGGRRARLRCPRSAGSSSRSSTAPRAAGSSSRRIERFAFYARAREAFAVVQTGETRLYGCVLLKMGVVRPA